MNPGSKLPPRAGLIVALLWVVGAQWLHGRFRFYGRTDALGEPVAWVALPALKARLDAHPAA